MRVFGSHFKLKDMNNFDIESYIEGSLSGKDLDKLEQEISRNLAFAAEVNLQRDLVKDLEDIRLRKQIKSALDEKDIKSRKKVFSKEIVGIIALALLAIVALYYIFQASKDADIPVEPKEQFLPTQQDSQALPVPRELEVKPLEDFNKKTEPKVQQQPENPQQAIAQSENIQPLAPPLYPSPNVRGQQEENTEWKDFLDEIWYNEYPIPTLELSPSFQKIDGHLKDRNFNKAYVRLQRMERKTGANDTLQLLKGYCLLEMGEGKEALLNFENLSVEHPQWKPYLDWYQGLSCLLIGEKEAAEKILVEIEKQKNHAFQKQAQKALLRLK